MKPFGLCLLVACALVGVAWGDTFTNTKTGEVWEGRLLGTASQDGKKVLVVNVAGKVHRLPADEWTAKRAERPAPQPPPAKRPKESTKPEQSAPKRPPTTTRRFYKYRGRRVSPEWFRRHYERFKDKLAVVDGRRYDIAKAKLRQAEISTSRPSVGAARVPAGASLSHGDTRAKVVQGVGENEVIMVRPGIRTASGRTRVPEVTFHVKGIDARHYSDEDRFNGWLIYVGTYSHQGRTLQSYVVHRPVTKEQFARALDRGLKLVEYRVERYNYRASDGGTREKVVVSPKPIP